MTAHRVASCRADGGIPAWIPEATPSRTCFLARRGALLLGVVVFVCSGLASPWPGAAWWPGRGYALYGGYHGGPVPWGPIPLHRPSRDYRLFRPPGAPLSYDDPASGTTYCWSPYAGAYFLCAYSSSSSAAAGLMPPPPPGIPAPPGEPAARAASGLFLFRLPQGAEVTLDGVPIGLSDGLGIYAVPPGEYRLVLLLSGKATAHTVSVRPHRIFTVTSTGVVPTEP